MPTTHLKKPVRASISPVPSQQLFYIIGIVLLWNLLNLWPIAWVQTKPVVAVHSLAKPRNKHDHQLSRLTFLHSHHRHQSHCSSCHMVPSGLKMDPNPHWSCQWCSAKPRLTSHSGLGDRAWNGRLERVSLRSILAEAKA